MIVMIIINHIYSLIMYTNKSHFLCVPVWAVCSPSQAQILVHFGPAVRTLGRITKLHLHCPQGAGSLSFPSAPPPPKGSAVGVVDHSCQLHLNVQVIIRASV